MAKATGLSRSTLYRVAQEWQTPRGKGIRRASGGCKRLQQRQPGLLSALEALVEPTIRGDLESVLR